jgi:transposase InsO family protein
MALKNKAPRRALEAACDIYGAFPVPIRGIGSDRGSEFINRYFKKWRDGRRITFTRGRSRHSNDNCFAEQKNGDVVKKTVGYARFEGDEALSALENVCSYLNPPINYFYPTKKLIAKHRLPSGKIKKVYGKRLKTPYQRFFEHPGVSGTLKSRASETRKSQDIVYLQERLEKACDGLGRVVSKNCAAFSLGGCNG